MTLMIQKNNPDVLFTPLSCAINQGGNCVFGHVKDTIWLLALFLLQACTTVPIPKDTSIAVNGFWEQDENTDPRFNDFTQGSAEEIGIIYTSGKNIYYNQSNAVNSAKIINSAHISTGPGSSARVEFKPASGKCAIQIEDFKIGKGYGNAANCQHQIFTSQADGRTVNSVYHIEVGQLQTQVTVLAGTLQLSLRNNPQQSVIVNGGQEVIATGTEILGPRPVSLDEIKRRVRWRDIFQYFDRQVDWSTVGKVAAVAIAIGVGVGVGTSGDDPPSSSPRGTANNPQSQSRPTQSVPPAQPNAPPTIPSGIRLN